MAYVSNREFVHNCVDSVNNHIDNSTLYGRYFDREPYHMMLVKSLYRWLKHYTRMQIECALINGVQVPGYVKPYNFIGFVAHQLSSGEYNEDMWVASGSIQPDDEDKKDNSQPNTTAKQYNANAFNQANDNARPAHRERGGYHAVDYMKGLPSRPKIANKTKTADKKSDDKEREHEQKFLKYLQNDDKYQTWCLGLPMRFKGHAPLVAIDPNYRNKYAVRALRYLKQHKIHKSLKNLITEMMKMFNRYNEVHSSRVDYIQKKAGSASF